MREAVFLWYTPLEVALSISLVAANNAACAAALSFAATAASTFLTAVLTLDLIALFLAALVSATKILFFADLILANFVHLQNYFTSQTNMPGIYDIVSLKSWFLKARHGGFSWKHTDIIVIESMTSVNTYFHFFRGKYTEIYHDIWKGADDMECMRVRTDLALEAKESFSGSDVEVHGVVVEEEYDKEQNLRLTRVRIESERGAREMGKPIGTYLTLEAPGMASPDEDYHREISEKLAEYLKELMGGQKNPSVLVVGLGNRDVTPDALGPKMVSNLLITRHLIREYGREVMGVGDCCEISGLAPGVMAQTGMETSEIIKGVVQEISPDLLIVIDALAARSTRRLCRTIQLTDTGIQPGSGVGNHRAALTKETLGIPVIAIGVPTVVEAAAIIYDAQGNCEQMPPHLNGMFVTPKNIDELIKQLSFTLSEALNMVFAHGER